MSDVDLHRPSLSSLQPSKAKHGPPHLVPCPIGLTSEATFEPEPKLQAPCTELSMEAIAPWRNSHEAPGSPGTRTTTFLSQTGKTGWSGNSKIWQKTSGSSRPGLRRKAEYDNSQIKSPTTRKVLLACSCLALPRKARPAGERISAEFYGTFMNKTYLLVNNNYRRAGVPGRAGNMGSHFLMPSMNKPCLKLKHPCCQHKCLKRPRLL